MTIEQSTTVGAAQASLDHLMGWVGVDGLVAAMSEPGLMALIDQHAAAIHEKLGIEVDLAALADYARVVHAAAVRRGEPLPDPATVDWTLAPPYLLRLVAVCAIATEIS
jgi:hypothetical protein